MATGLLTHDHDAEVGCFGICLTCADRKVPAPPPDVAEQLGFDDPSFVAAGADGGNHAAQMVRLVTVLADGRWRSLDTIAEETGDPRHSVAARLRDLSTPQFGSWVVERRTTTAGLEQARAHPA